MFDRVNIEPRRVILVPAFGIVAVALLLDIAIRNDPISVDFHTYMAAAQVGLKDGWSHIYDQALVATEQKQLMPSQVAQPFISPPTVALLVAPLAMIPFEAAYVVWALITFAVFALALAWSGTSRGWARWIAVIGALAPWWVMHAINVGQVVPLVAAGCVLGWRLLRDRRDALAGIALLAIVLKPNTALLVPAALLVAMRWRALASWAAGVAVIMVVLPATVGVDGLVSYVSQLMQPLPGGADNLTLHGALDATGIFALLLRVLIACAVLASAYQFRNTGGLLMPVAIVGSLIVSPYLHGSDLCMLAAAAWMVWEEKPTVVWRLPLALGWLLASPYFYLRGMSPELRHVPWLELALLCALVLVALRPLTGWADSRSRAPA